MSSGSQVGSQEVPDTSEEEKPLLARVENLQLHFDTDRGTVKALDGVSFDIYEGETVALVGETGCGKSVTARSFTKLVPTPPGRYVNGQVLLRSEQTCSSCGGSGCSDCYETGNAFQDLLSMNTEEMHHIRSDRIAMVFQDPAEGLNPSLRIKTQIAESVLVNHGKEILVEAGLPPEETGRLMNRIFKAYASPSLARFERIIASIPPLRKYRDRIDELVHERIVDILEQTQIPNPEDVLKNYPHELSGGQQQRIMIAMALVAEPDLLIADEPTTALDVTIQTRILSLMEDLQETFNTSFLYITHDLSLVEDIADRVVVMYAGEVAETGPVESMYEDPLHPYTWGLIESIPTKEKVGKDLTGIEGSIPDLTNPPEGCRFCTRCPEVLDHCADVEPELVEETPGHKVACHLYPPDGENLEGARRGTLEQPNGGESDE
jgi:oligopeptide/dipeptide ABC transporter ATP-binding protein